MSILGGLAYIAKKQLRGGGFRSYRLDDRTGQYVGSYRTTFAPSLISIALSEVENTEIIREKISQFLLAQRSPEWSWNYWDRASSSMVTMPYPDDLDDTFLALAALWQYDTKLFTPNVMASIAHLLFATEERTGGPYRTWLIDESADAAWKDIDTVVNINIAGFLALQEVSLPRVDKLVERAIVKQKFESSYYSGLFPGIYFLARWYKGVEAESLRKLILHHQVLGAWETPHRTAMAISSLLRLGYPAEKLKTAVDYIVLTQEAEGGWPAGPMYYDTAQKDDAKLYFVGASSLTTALCLEALALYERMMVKPVASLRKRTSLQQYNRVVKSAELVIENVEQKDLRLSTQNVLRDIIRSDSDQQIIMLPWLIANATGRTVAASILHDLALTSLWGWTAYTIYDDFLDNEGDPHLLPAAIFANRQLTNVLRTTLEDDEAFQQEVMAIMNRLDGANAWEVHHCRGVIEEDLLLLENVPDYDDYWQLADRSLGHTIAGIGVLYAAGYNSHSPDMVGLKDFFIHYLIARQLNDDAHDWEKDFSNCHVNAVGALILNKWLESTGRELEKGVNLKKDMKALRLLMWESIIDEVCRRIDEHITAARQALRKPGIELDADMLLQLLLPLEMASKRALDTRDQAMKFIGSL